MTKILMSMNEWRERFLRGEDLTIEGTAQVSVSIEHLRFDGGDIHPQQCLFTVGIELPTGEQPFQDGNPLLTGELRYGDHDCEEYPSTIAAHDLIRALLVSIDPTAQKWQVDDHSSPPEQVPEERPTP